jgi:hypothetical protein
MGRLRWLSTRRRRRYAAAAATTNTNHLNAVAGIVAAFVGGVVVAVAGRTDWVMGTRMVESENRARFSRREGEYIFTVPLLSGDGGC